jgi:hypothetical protein
MLHMGDEPAMHRTAAKLCDYLDLDLRPRR